MAELLKGVPLQRKDGTPVNIADLKGKVVGLYFSAHWCPPCRRFTPELAEFYETVNKAEKKFEVVFLSNDRSAEEAAKYVNESHGNWLYATPDQKIVEELSQKYDVGGIPTLVIIRADGSVISADGRDDVASGQPPQVTFSGWQSRL